MRIELQNVLETVMRKDEHRLLDPLQFFHRLCVEGCYHPEEEQMFMQGVQLHQRKLTFIQLTRSKPDIIITKLIKTFRELDLDIANCFEKELMKENLSEFIPQHAPRPSSNRSHSNATDQHINGTNTKKILVIGSTGNGKSTLCNRIITPAGNTETVNFFEESDDIESETKTTIGQNGSWNGMSVFVIDTPGMSDSDGIEAIHLVTMIDFLKAQHDIHAVLLVFNAQQDRFDSNLQRLICLLTGVFNSPEFWDHVALVFTKSFAAVKIDKEKKRRRHGEFVAKIVESTGLSAIKKPQSFFVDSKDFKDVNTREDLRFLSVWANNLDAIGTQKLQQPDEKYLTNNYTKMREMTEELELKDKELKVFKDKAAREKKANELFHNLLGTVNGAPWGDGWGNVDRGSRSCSFTFEGRQINAFEEKWINKNFARIILTDAESGQRTEGTASYSNDGVNSYEVRRSSACRQFVNLGFVNEWWTI